MKLKKTIVAAVLSVAVSSASAGYLANKSDWDGMSEPAKHGYVMGYMDSFDVRRDAAGSGSGQYVLDLRQCLYDLGVNSTSLVEIVELQYQDLEIWGQPPFLALEKGIRKVCLNYINRARIERGQEPFTE